MPLEKAPVTPTTRRLKRAVRKFDRYFKEWDIGLRDHQSSAMKDVKKFLMEGVERLEKGETASGAIVMPCGSGKTVVAAAITVALGVRALIISPTIKIALQNQEEFAAWSDLDASIYYSKEKDLSGQVISTTYHSALRLLAKGIVPEDIDIIFYDEAHRSISTARRQLHGSLGNFDIGLTATPSFNEQKCIWNVFDDKISEVGIQDAVELGALCSLRGFLIETGVDVRNVKLKNGDDLDVKAAERHLNVLARNRAARDFYLDGFQHMGAVAYCISIDHANKFASYLRRSGVKAASVHSDMPIGLREERLRSFEEGFIDVITSRDVIIEGWDSNRVSMELCLRPTYSRVLKGQMTGRVLRPGKECGIVVDFQDQYKRGQEPLLIYHIFNEPEYRQGGLILAPAKKKKEEDERLSRRKKVKVAGKAYVSYEKRKLVSFSCGDESQRVNADELALENIKKYKKVGDADRLLDIASDKRVSMGIRLKAGEAAFGIISGWWSPGHWLLKIHKRKKLPEKIRKKALYLSIPLSNEQNDWRTLRKITHDQSFSHDFRVMAGIAAVEVMVRKGRYSLLIALSENPAAPLNVQKNAVENLGAAVRNHDSWKSYDSQYIGFLRRIARDKRFPKNVRVEAGMKLLKRYSNRLNQYTQSMCVYRISEDESFDWKVRQKAQSMIKKAEEKGNVHPSHKTPRKKSRKSSVLRKTNPIERIESHVEKGEYKELIAMGENKKLKLALRELAQGKIFDAALNALKEAMPFKPGFKIISDESLPADIQRKLIVWAINTNVKTGKFKRLLSMSKDERLPNDLRKIAKKKVNDAASNYVEGIGMLSYFDHDFWLVMVYEGISDEVKKQAGLAVVQNCKRLGYYEGLRKIRDNLKYPFPVRKAAGRGINAAANNAIKKSVSLKNSAKLLRIAEDVDFPERVRSRAKEGLKSLKRTD